MKPLTIVEIEISSQAFDGVGDGFVIVQVDLFVFDATPKPLDKDIVQGSTSPIHADGDFMLFENSSEGATRELRSLISVKYLGLRYLERSIQGAQTELALHTRRDFPTEDVA